MEVLADDNMNNLGNAHVHVEASLQVQQDNTIGGQQTHNLDEEPSTSAKRGNGSNDALPADASVNVHQSAHAHIESHNGKHTDIPSPPIDPPTTADIAKDDNLTQPENALPRFHQSTGPEGKSDNDAKPVQVMKKMTGTIADGRLHQKSVGNLTMLNTWTRWPITYVLICTKIYKKVMCTPSKNKEIGQSQGALMQMDNSGRKQTQSLMLGCWRQISIRSQCVRRKTCQHFRATSTAEEETKCPRARKWVSSKESIRQCS